MFKFWQTNNNKGTVTNAIVTKVETFEVGDVDLAIGSLKIVNDEPSKGAKIGFGTKIFFYGVEQKGIVSIDIHIAVEDVITATIKRFV